MSNLCAFILHAHTKPEKSDEFETLFKEYVAPSRDEAGCIEYHMLRDQQDPALFLFYEVWKSQADLDQHLALPHMQRFIAQRMDYLTRDFDIQSITMVSPSSAKR